MPVVYAFDILFSNLVVSDGNGFAGNTRSHKLSVFTETRRIKVKGASQPVFVEQLNKTDVLCDAVVKAERDRFELFPFFRFHLSFFFPRKCQ